MSDEFLTDIMSIRKRAREQMADGAVTDEYKADPKLVISVLNQALATELVCVLRYKRHYYAAQGLSSLSVKQKFLEHAKEEQEHADSIAERITQLGGKPDFNPATLTRRSHSEYCEGDSLVSMLQEDLVAERIAVGTYAEIASWLGSDDPTTRRLIERILEKEEEHAEDLISLLGHIATDANKEQRR